MMDAERIDEEELLDRFRHWLREASAEADRLDAEGTEPEAPVVGLYRLVEEFTALRHEVKLQTRGTRGLQEQAESLLGGLRGAIEQFQSVEPREQQAAWAAGRSLAEALAELNEALDRGRAGIERLRQRYDEGPTLDESLADLFARQSWLERLFTRSYHARVMHVARQGVAAFREQLDALDEGYELIQSRLRRALRAEEIEPIDAPGQPVDPERMTVVEMVDRPDLPPGVVVDEVRRGYTWKGRVLRFAEVRAARKQPS